MHNADGGPHREAGLSFESRPIRRTRHNHYPLCARVGAPASVPESVSEGADAAEPRPGASFDAESRCHT